MKILNLTQHVATQEQLVAGVFEPANKEEVRTLLTFTAVPTSADMTERAEALARIVLDEKAEAAMIGGAPYFMSSLEKVLQAMGIRLCYSFTERKTTETVDPTTGAVHKTQVFVHSGWVWVE